ncbi:MAG: hypothetical protein ACRELB_27095 [Polyangiaceae bacterium]
MPCIARAAEPNKLECIAANDAAQDLRRAGKLRGAREKLLLCDSPSCPGLVRQDCAQRLVEIDAVMPSLVFEARDSTGKALAAVEVTMDGQPLADRLDGLPMRVDPGEHRFVFASAGLSPTEKTIVVHEWDREHHETVVLGTPASPMAPAPPPSNPSPQRTIAFVLGSAGVVGLAVGSVMGLVSKSSYDHALQTECGNNPNGGCSRQGIADGKSAHGQAAASTVAFFAGGALLGAGAVLYFTAPTASVSVGTTIGTERTGLAIAGVW